MGGEFVFMDDNARPYRAIIINEFFQSENIIRIERPAFPPDLNLIKHLWDMLGWRVNHLFEWINFLKISTIIWYSACLGVVRTVFHRMGDNVLQSYQPCNIKLFSIAPGSKNRSSYSTIHTPSFLFFIICLINGFYVKSRLFRYWSFIYRSIILNSWTWVH